MPKQLLFPSPFPLLLIILFFCSPTTLAQSPAKAPTAAPLPQPLVPSPPARAPPPAKAPVAPGPKPSGPANVTAIFEKAGHFTTFLRLLRSTQLDSRIYKELNGSSQGLTILAPSDNAFGNLSIGTLNSFSDQQKVQLAEFHILPSYLTLPQFQTVSNPLPTQAGDTSKNQFPLNVVTTGGQVNISSFIVNTTISDTVYTDGQLAVYQIDDVLIPRRFFVTPAPAPAPAAPKAKDPPSSGSVTTAPVTSGSTTAVINSAVNVVLLFVVSVVAVSPFCF